MYFDLLLHLSSRKIFIEYTHKRITIYISTKGSLYNRISGESFDAKRANEIWTTLYELAKDRKLGVSYVSCSS